MTLIELMDERGAIYVVNVEHIMEVEPLGEDKCRLYMASSTCRAHAVVFLTTAQELLELHADSLLPENYSDVLATKAVHNHRMAEKAAEEDELLRVAEDALAAKTASL